MSERTQKRDGLMAEGIEVRHRKGCRSRRRPVGCQPTYRASVWLNREGRRIRSLSDDRRREGVAQDAAAAAQGHDAGPSPTTLAEAAEAWLAGARDGSIRNRSGDPYKPSAIRGYERRCAAERSPTFALKLDRLRADRRAGLRRRARRGH